MFGLRFHALQDSWCPEYIMVFLHLGFSIYVFGCGRLLHISSYDTVLAPLISLISDDVCSATPLMTYTHRGLY